MAGTHPSRETGLTILAPAKVNLTLEVLARRPDGFHEIRSVVQAISLCDHLSFRLSPGMEFGCDNPDWIAEQSLVPKAVSLLKETTRYSEGVTTEISKRIPLLSGLGGDSSDAAATLLGLNRLWGLGLPLPELAGLASRLGSDVAFFLYGGTALLQGRGEIVTPLPPLPRMWVVLLVPPVPRLPGKTGRLYASLNTSHYTQGEVTDRLVASLIEKEGVRLASDLFNVFDSVADAGLEQYQQQFLAAGAPVVHLAGSGPTLFTLVGDRVRAEQIHRRLKQAGLESYLSETLEIARDIIK